MYMQNWIYVCDKKDIDFEDLIRFDYKEKTFCIYNIIYIFNAIINYLCMD